MINYLTVRLLAVSLLVLPSISHAQQLKFASKNTGQNTDFSVTFRDVVGQQRSLGFSLEQTLVSQSNQAILGLNRITQIANSQAADGVQELVAISRARVQKDYEKLYQQTLARVENANRQLAPFFAIEAKRAGKSDFGIRTGARGSGNVSYYWQTPSLQLASRNVDDVKTALRELVDAENKKLAGKVTLILGLRGDNIQLKLRVQDAQYNEQGSQIFQNVQNKMNGLIEQQNLAARLSTQHFKIITDFVEVGLKQLKKSAELQMDQFQNSYRQLRNQALAQYRLKLVQYEKGQDVLRVDYQRVVQEALPAMRGVMKANIDAMPANSGLRDHVQNSLNFVQTIPYDALNERDLEGLSGFLLPVSMIAQNRGDCDTKSVALLAMLAHIIPVKQGVPMIMILIPGHAFIGVQIAKQDGDQTYRYQNNDYVLLEVAGPALLPVGQLGPMSAKALRSRQVTEIIPINGLL